MLASYSSGPGPGSILAYPPSGDRGSLVPPFLLLPPPAHQPPRDVEFGDGKSRNRRQRRFVGHSAANNSDNDDDDEEAADDPSFVPPPWTEPQTADNCRTELSSLSGSSQLTTAQAKTTASRLSSAETAGLKVRVDILKTPLDRLHQLGRSLEDDRSVCTLHVYSVN